MFVLAYKLSYNFKLMSLGKELLSVVSNIAELVLQGRNWHNRLFITHLHHLQNDLSLLRQEQNPSSDFIQFIINKPAYSIRNKLSSHLKSSPSTICLHLEFTLTDKLNDLTEAAQIWKIFVYEKANKSSKNEQLEQLIHVVSFLVCKLLQQSYLNNVLKNKQYSKKLVFDYKIGFSQNITAGQNQLTSLGSLMQVKTLLSQSLQMKIHYFQRKQSNYFTKCQPNIPQNENKMDKRSSEQTALGQSSNDSLYRVHRKRFNSFEQNEQIVELYDKELDVTIISSDNVIVGERQKEGQYFFEQIDSFELLIDESKSQDLLFIDKNEDLFKQWERLHLTMLS